MDHATICHVYEKRQTLEILTLPAQVVEGFLGRRVEIMKRKSHTYKGESILPCSEKGSKRWYVPAKHHTGTPYGEKDSQQFATLRDAKEAIDYDRRVYGEP